MEGKRTFFLESNGSDINQKVDFKCCSGKYKKIQQNFAVSNS